jgi:flagellin-like hook-associated protein FlgL
LTPYEIDESGNILYHGTPHDNPDYIRQTEVADGVYEVINTTGDKVFGHYEKYFTASGSDTKYYKVTDSDGNVTYKDKDGNVYTGSVSDLTEQEDYSGVMGALRLLSASIQEVVDAKDAKDSAAETAGYEKMFSTLDMFSKSHNDIVTEQTKFGGVYNRLVMTESTLETNTENLTSYLSSMQDVDIASAASKWLQAQYSYQASLQVAASTMGMSLLNYL